MSLDLRLIVITDHGLAAPRSVYEVVEAALRAGAPAIQLRDKNASASSLLAQALELRALTARYHALLFVNDRVDVALAARADGVHLGPSDLPLASLRRFAGDLILGFSTDDPDAASLAVLQGADYIGCGAVYGTRSKDVGAERIGLEGLGLVVRAVHVPVVAIGGITTDNVGAIAQAGAAGCAVIGAVMHAPDPGAAVQALLRPFTR